MEEKSKIIKHGLLVTIGSFVLLVLAFVLYFMIFMLFETLTDDSYFFVSPLRIGYGILWIVLCLILYRTRMYEWLKACMLACSLGTFMIAESVVLYKTPVIGGLVMIFVTAAGVFLLYKMKKEWFHYYAIVLANIAALSYL